MTVQGREYVSLCTGKTVVGKEFEAVISCCPKKCYTKIDSQQQKKLYDKFWQLGDYTAQNVLLSTFMKERNSKTEGTILHWDYYFPYQFQVNDELAICQKFLLNVIGIKKTRIQTLQTKIKNNESLEDRRGTTSNHFAKLTDNLKKLILEHCESLSHSKSHYTREDSNLNYFKDSDLTLTSLYTKFVIYYALKTGDKKCPLSESTYSKYFNHFVNFTFDVPRTDCCNQCYENEKLGKENDPAAREHKEKVREHYELKKKCYSRQRKIYVWNLILVKIFHYQNFQFPRSFT